MERRKPMAWLLDLDEDDDELPSLLGNDEGSDSSTQRGLAVAAF
jgi:hypothetical protein